MQTSGDEMELFASVNRKFRHTFAQQEHMKSFKTYDTDLVGNFILSFINCSYIYFDLINKTFRLIVGVVILRSML